MLLVFVVLMLLSAVLYLAYMSGFFGTVKGARIPWWRAYKDKANQYDDLWALYEDGTELLTKAEAECETWRTKADFYSEDLERCSSELERASQSATEWESRYWRAELILNDTLSQKEAVEIELDTAESESGEWKLKYLTTKGSLDCLEIMYSDLKDDLGELTRRLAQTTSDRDLLEAELRNRTVEIIKLKYLLELASSDLRWMTRERDAWASRFGELEISYKDLLCELKMSKALAEKYKGLYEEQARRLEETLAELEEYRSRCERLASTLNQSNLENRELRRLYESTLANLRATAAEMDRWKAAYQDLYRRYNASVGDAGYWRSMYGNLSVVLAQVRSERDVWILLYQSVSAQLSECQSEVRYWMSLYATCQSELEDALAEARYWKALYQGLANISLHLEIVNASVVSRSCGKPSVVSADIRVCVSTRETPIYMYLEYWAEPLDCVYGYGSILEDVSTWPGNCKTFRVTLNFGKGISSYKIVARASLRPIHGYDEVWKTGPT